jgi:hypothetical protein
MKHVLKVLVGITAVSGSAFILYSMVHFQPHDPEYLVGAAIVAYAFCSGVEGYFIAADGVRRLRS